MTMQWRTLARRYGWWLALMIGPLCVNSVIWTAFVKSQQQRARTWTRVETLLELKPKFETLLADSHQIVTEWERTGFTKDDPSRVVQTIQRLADQHRIQLEEINAKEEPSGRRGQGAPAVRPITGFATMPITLQAAGRFSKLTHWISDLEASCQLQVDSLTLTTGEDPNGPLQLTVQLTAFLRET